ncbi:DUF1800 domain-containing protein [Rhodoferax lacus]|nr:DUF1800 domain-containing protein [Rhodoferax lacus]
MRLQAPPTLHRRQALQTIARCAALATGGVALAGWAQPPAQAPMAAPPAGLPGGTAAAVDRVVAEQWRVLSRLGYGPTASLVQELQAASNPRAWALQQIDTAQRASQSAPMLSAELQDINAPLPQIFVGAQRERQARASLKATGDTAEKNASTADTPNMDARQRLDFSVPAEPQNFNRSMIEKTAVWRLQASSQPAQENILLARMTEFWFNHLNVYIGKGAVRPFVGHYLIHVARAHALGKFEDLLLASARHPAMLHYLDQAQSVANGTRGAQGSTRGLNENYARELMELHTLGVDGGYTQNDVHELARVLTGWTVGPNAADGFRFALRTHDGGNKRVLGHSYPEGLLGRGEAEGEQAIRMLARQPQTARRLSLRLAQFFVADQPSPALVQRLSKTFLDSQGDIKVWLQTLVQSPEFWDPANRLFKTPMDFACSALTATGAAPDRRALLLTLGFLNNAGQPLHGWQTPDGYKTDAATWLAPEALTRRADYALALGKLGGDLDFLRPYLGAATLDTVARQKPGLQNGLLLASPEFMYK